MQPTITARPKPNKHTKKAAFKVKKDIIEDKIIRSIDRKTARRRNKFSERVIAWKKD